MIKIMYNVNNESVVIEVSDIKIAIFTDNRGGMLFNHRRQVRDTEVIADLVKYFGKGDIYVDSFSAKQFAEYENVHVCENPVLECEEGGLCVIECPEKLVSLEKASTFIIYNWCIKYPADEYFTLDLAELGFKRISKKKFATLIHPKVTCDVYKK